MICKNELRCIMKDRYCSKCKHNPNAELEDYFIDRGYIPACKYGFKDCVYDPAYMLHEYYNDVWVREVYSMEKLEQEIKNGCDCDDGEYYENEDK